MNKDKDRSIVIIAGAVIAVIILGGLTLFFFGLFAAPTVRTVITPIPPTMSNSVTQMEEFEPTQSLTTTIDSNALTADVSTSESTPTLLPTPLTQAEEDDPSFGRSPNGQWRFSIYTSELFPPTAEELEEFPDGLYEVEMSVHRTDGSQKWTAVNEWRAGGLGSTYPQLVRWSADGRFLYYANVATPDGCSIFTNGGDLWRLNLDNGEIEEIAPYIGLVMALSPDETELAVHASYGRGFLIRDLETGVEQPIPLPEPNQWWQIGGLEWSPDGQHLLFMQIFSPCSPEMKTAVIRIDIDTLTTTTIVAADERQFTQLEWIGNDEVKLQDQDGKAWYFDAFSGDLVRTEAAAPTNLVLFYLQNRTLMRLQMDDMESQVMLPETEGDISAALLDVNGPRSSEGASHYLAYEFENGLHLLDTNSGKTTSWLVGSVDPWQKFRPRAWNGNGRLLVQRSYGTESSTLGWAEIGDDSWHPLPLPDDIMAEHYGFDSGASWLSDTQIVIGGYDYGLASNVPGLTIIDLETETAERLVTRWADTGEEGGGLLTAGVFDPIGYGGLIFFSLEGDAVNHLDFPRDLYIVTSEGTSLSRLTENFRGHASNLIWATANIFYYSLTHVSEDDDGIYSYVLDAGASEVLLYGMNLAPLGVSEDGGVLAYSQTRIEGNLHFQDLRILNIDTGETTLVAEGRDGSPALFVGWDLDS